MTVDEVIAHLQQLVAHGLSPSAIVKAWNGDSNQVEPVTGFLYNENEVEICTDDTD